MEDLGDDVSHTIGSRHVVHVLFHPDRRIAQNSLAGEEEKGNESKSTEREKESEGGKERERQRQGKRERQRGRAREREREGVVKGTERKTDTE